MAKDEVELGDGSGEDYEVVPVGPIRKLERRIDEIEEQSKKGGAAADDELIHDVLDIMKSNQKIVNDMTESTHQLKNSVEDLTHKMDSVIDNMNSFMDLLEEASEADLEGEVMNDVHARIADAVGNEMKEVAADIKESNSKVVENLEDLNKSIKRSYAAQNKENTLPDNSQQGVLNRSQSNQGDGGKQQQAGGGQQRGNDNTDRGPSLDIDRDRDRNENNSRQNRRSGGRGDNAQRGNSGSERMRKLKERFDKVEDEQ